MAQEMSTDIFIALVNKLADLDSVWLDVEKHPSEYDETCNLKIAEVFKTAVTTYKLLK